MFLEDSVLFQLPEMFLYKTKKNRSKKNCYVVASMYINFRILSLIFSTVLILPKVEAKRKGYVLDWKLPSKRTDSSKFKEQNIGKLSATI